MGLPQVTGNTASTGGSSLTVYGLNFGTVDLSATSTIRLAECRSTSWISYTSVSCSTANLIAPTTSLTVSRLTGTGATFFCYDSAVLSYSLLNIAPSGGSSLTVTGLNFGAYASTATVDMEGYSCSTTSWTASTAVACVDQLRGSGWPLRSRGYMMATVGALAGTGLSAVSFDAPVLSYVDRNMVQSNVRHVTIGGLSFGIEVYTQSAGSLGAACRTTSWSSLTSVQCGIDLFTVSIASQLQLTVNAVLGSANLFGFSLDSPVVSSVVRNAPLSGGASVTVTGLSFGTQDTTASTGLDSVSCQTSTWTTGTSLLCLMADMQASVALMLSAAVVTVGGISGTQNAMLLLSFDAPTLSLVCACRLTVFRQRDRDRSHRLGAAFAR